MVLDNSSCYYNVCGSRCECKSLEERTQKKYNLKILMRPSEETTYLNSLWKNDLICHWQAVLDKENTVNIVE